jgi:hypothetical protein
LLELINYFKEHATMFSVIIKGRTMGDLKDNLSTLMRCLGMEQEIKVSEELKEKMFEAVEYTKNHAPPLVDNSVDNVEKPLPVEIPDAPSATTSATDSVNKQDLPWDERIHAVTQAKNKDGSWRYKRGVEPETIKSVEEELKQRLVQSGKTTKNQQLSMDTVAEPIATPPQVAPAPIPVPFQPEPVAAPVSVPHVVAVPPTLQMVPPFVAAPVPVSQSLPPPMPGQPLAHSLATFKANLVQTLARLVSEGKLTQEYLQQLKNYFGVENIWQVNDEQLKQLFEEFALSQLILKVEA